MRSILTILSLMTIILTVTFGFQPANAAGESGHSDLQRLLAAIYGFNLNASDLIATVNQSVDKVPLSAATQSGSASAKLHFSTTVTESDLDEQDLMKLLKNNNKRTFMQVLGMFFKNSTLGGGVASLGNAESAEALGKAIKKGDGYLYLMGLHYVLDTSAAFHDGYLGAISNPIPLLNKLPFLHKFAFGHFTDGTSTDRLSIGKIVLAMDALGPFLITLRNSQKDTVGVNKAWLQKLQSEGVDINDNESIRNWFMNQEIVKKILQKSIPANRSYDYAKVIVDQLKERLIQLDFFNDSNYMNNKLDALAQHVNVLRQMNDTKTSINDLIFQFIDLAWTDGKLNEKVVIRETMTDYFGLFGQTEKLNGLIYDAKYVGLPAYAQEEVENQLKEKKTRAPHTHDWIVDQIVAKVTREMISQSWEKFNTAYLNDVVESEQKNIEENAVGTIEKHFFNRTGKYSYNPGVEHWAKVRSTWYAMSSQERGNNFLEKIITYCDLVVRTKAFEGKEIHSLNRALKAKIFFKTMSYIFHEEYRNPITSAGNFAVRVNNLRARIEDQIRREFPEGMLTEEMLAKSKKYNDYVNAKFNSDQAVGIRQNTAVTIKKTAEFLQKISGQEGKTRAIKCESLFI